MTEPVQRVEEFISSQGLITAGDKLLVTVSGGMDSMFLLNFLVNKKILLAVAHCNFGLRGDESEGDETFVKAFCNANKIKLHVKKFETEEYANENGISIQMAARDLRYQWFDELCKMEDYTKIVTAHHKTDHAETILLNLIRGTGLKGLEGIAAKSGNKIRPLLCLGRDEIKSLTKELKINYREDSSNKSDKYHRNRLRLNVLPELKKINPELENTLEANAGIIKQANDFINFYIEATRKEILKEGENSLVIDGLKLLNSPEPKFVLYSLLSVYRFNSSNISDIFDTIKGLSGKQFYSNTHRLIIDRSNLIIEPIHDIPFQSFTITLKTGSVETPYHRWHFKMLDKSPEKPLLVSEACLDLEKISFPLTLRPWQHGDKLKPLGMQGHKKVSDILIDKKLSLIQKEKIYVLVSGNDILWVGGLVLNEDHKLKPSTKKILWVRFEDLSPE